MVTSEMSAAYMPRCRRAPMADNPTSIHVKLRCVTLLDHTRYGGDNVCTMAHNKSTPPNTTMVQVCKL
jgi:hypothetical protein